MLYEQFRCAYLKTYQDVYRSLMDCSDNPEDWKYKRRHTILGYWHMIKLEEWAHHKVDCAEAARYDQEAEARLDWESPAISMDIPF